MLDIEKFSIFAVVKRNPFGAKVKEITQKSKI